MFCLKELFAAKRVRMIIIISAVAFCLPAGYSYGQDSQTQPVFTGKDAWKNKYIKRAQEISKLKQGITTRQPASTTGVREFDPQLFEEMRKAAAALASESEKPDTERKLFKKYVNSYVTVLDPKSVSDIFGRRIAKRYVAFQVTISNESKDYQFLVQDVSIDLSDVADLESVNIPANYKPSSNDLTLLRGVSEKGQVYDWRNLASRILRGTGSVAAGLIGVTTFGSSYAPSVAIYNGPFASSFRDVLPDLTVTQLNRLNDSAYQSNTLVPRQGAKVMVAFVDQALLLDDELQKRFYSNPMAIADIIDFRKARAEVHGMLITDVLDQPPLVSAVVIDQEQQKRFLDKPATIEGRVIGRNFTGASIQLENADTGVEVKVKGVPESTRLDFTLTSKEPILPGKVLNFVVVRNNDVSKYSFPVSYTIEVPMLDSISPNKLNQGDAGKEITLKGKGFIKSLFTVTGCDGVMIKESTWQSSTEIKVKVDVAADAAIGQCHIKVKNGDNFVSGPQSLTIERAAN